MSTSSSALLDDIFFIPTVPRYKELGGEMDDTIGDGLFELLTLNVENIAPETKIIEPPKPVRRSMRLSMDHSAKSAKETKTAKEEVPKVKAQPRPVRRSLMMLQLPKDQPKKEKENKEEVKEELPEVVTTKVEKVVPEIKPAKMEKQKLSKQLSQPVFPKAPPKVPKALPTPKVTTSSVFVNQKPAIVQPPMRFGNSTQRRSILPESQPSTPKRSSSSVFGSSKPTLVQPPMRFGNTTQRRSVMPESPNRPSASGISHAVRGIAVSRRTQLFDGKK